MGGEIYERQDCFAYLEKGTKRARLPWKSTLIAHLPNCGCLNKLYCRTEICNFYAHKDTVDLDAIEISIVESRQEKGGSNGKSKEQTEAKGC